VTQAAGSSSRRLPQHREHAGTAFAAFRDGLAPQMAALAAACQAEDGRWLAICDDCCDFVGAVSAWRRAFRIHDAIAHAKKSPAAAGPT